jgi:hypothetical protein
MKVKGNLKTRAASRLRRRSAFVSDRIPSRFRRIEIQKRVGTSAETNQRDELISVSRLTALTQLILIKSGRII